MEVERFIGCAEEGGDAGNEMTLRVTAAVIAGTRSPTATRAAADFIFARLSMVWVPLMREVTVGERAGALAMALRASAAAAGGADFAASATMRVVTAVMDVA